MFDLIKKIISSSNSKAQTTDQDALTAHLALTVLLLEAAYADGECSEEEKEHLAATLVTNFGIERKEIDTLLADRDKEHREYVDLFRYTHFINENFSEKQKIDIMESVWRIILLDDHLEAHEDHFAHKLATLLRLNHSELINAKLRARKQLL
ncbi:MAG: TerB family tellurite resistance protein [Proteobacteria bacterium]|nr:TerB family tellurite resistance protein [Pseudomonadota bacterium]MBU1582064.1 TerB family tellurite resistance protein [Pseudomonadota bacterium]MBU2452128.1 TerB family tellurite resistance protein [Pseudomonadota bacterium]MBU2628367.1 TerB family tellurite resistance protein [Pseudomonadota bacterium]